MISRRRTAASTRGLQGPPALGSRTALAAVVVAGAMGAPLMPVLAAEAGAQQDGALPAPSITTVPPSTTTSTVGAPPRPPPAPVLPPATPGPPPPVDDSPPPVLVVPLDAAAKAAEAGRRRAMAELAAAEKELRTARSAQSRADERLRQLGAEVSGAEARLAQRSSEEQEAARLLAAARRRMRDLAVAQYLGGGSVAPAVAYLARARSAEDMVRRGALLDLAGDYYRSAAHSYEQARKQASERVEADVRALEAANAARAQGAAEVHAASELVAQRTAEVDNRRLLVDLATASAPVVPSDVPRLLLDAYRRAAGTAQRQRNCTLRWTDVAAIGKVESDHGRFRGAQLALNGDLFPPIIGIRLDGTRSALVADSDGGAMDGDPAFDRAVGPMQFIPTTWKQMSSDGNGDGVENVHNAYDAALATATYLCRAAPGGRLDVEEGRRAAFFSYNRSDAYVDTVLTWARTYDGLGLR